MESGTPRGLRAFAIANSFFGFAKEKSSEMAMDSGCFAATRSERFQIRGRRRGQDFAVAGGAFFDAEAEIFGTSGSMRSKKKS
jgi:hypothetical protein